MPCVVCGCPRTCNAHILPKSLALYTRGGKSAKTPLRVVFPDSKQSSAGGIFDPNILCDRHDNHLGNSLDKPVVEFMRLLGTERERNLDHHVEIESDIAPSILENFAISVAWRASVSSKLNDFSVGPHNELKWKNMLFSGAECKVKVMIWRIYDEEIPEKSLIHYPFRYRDKKGRNAASFFAGGLLFNIGTDRKNASYIENIYLSSINKSNSPIKIWKASMQQTGLKDAVISSVNASRW